MTVTLSLEVLDFTLALTAGDVFVGVLCSCGSAADQRNMSYIIVFLSAKELFML